MKEINENQFKYFKKRSLYYGSTMILNPIKHSIQYYNFQSFISLPLYTTS